MYRFWSCGVNQGLPIPVLAPPRSAQFLCLYYMKHLIQNISSLEESSMNSGACQLTGCLPSVYCALLPEHELVEVLFTWQYKKLARNRRKCWR